MIERDYIMRILQEFFNAIAKLVRINACSFSVARRNIFMKRKKI